MKPSIPAHNISLYEEMFEVFRHDPSNLHPSWRHFFEGMEWGEQIEGTQDAPSKELRIYHLINAYRTYGHLLARVNPIELEEWTFPHQLELKNLGFGQSELNETFPTLGLFPQEEATLAEILDILRLIYCGTVSVEYMHTNSPELQSWLQKEIEPSRFRPSFSNEKKKEIYAWLSKSTLFEAFLHTRYVGQKRFSLEGGETLIPILQELIELGEEHGADEFVLGMAHRGRLNVLTNILHKSFSMIFAEFEDFEHHATDSGSGDVKYHKGFSSNIKTKKGKQVHVSLTANPSHLESVVPVVEGKTRAKQEQRNDPLRKKIIPILIHGDASIAGQGVVYETMQMFRLPGYTTGGTIHIVVNNQIGFTTLPQDSRSTPYCTTLAGAFSSPIFHCNAEDPEGCVYAAKLALQIRQKYGIDVFIDMNCYRKYGHNEGDEPTFTQPLQYALIQKKKNIRHLYLERLLIEGVFKKEDVEELEKDFHQELHKHLEESKKNKQPPKDEAFEGVWKEYRSGNISEEETKVSKKRLIELNDKLTHIPQNFALHPKLEKLQMDRLQTVKAEGEIDFATAESLSFASLLEEGFPIRLAGQDSRRGTFSQRHAVWIDQKTGEPYYPLQHLSEKQGHFTIYDSPLSEFAALGFEFGYSLAYPSSLVIWEAQFGDFANGAQVIIDQYISASEQKWTRYSGLVLLLPHGFEGQGPEHSSARVERYLQLAGDNNIQIVNPTTPANYFHLLRSQTLRKAKKPLIVFTPKSLHRHPKCKSPLKDFYEGSFQPLLVEEVNKNLIKRILLMSGKIYYDLRESKEKKKREDVALIRIERVYPFPENELLKEIQSYPQAKEVIWVQEEPENMGPLRSFYPTLTKIIPSQYDVRFISRKASAAVAVGSYVKHRHEQEAIINEAL